MKKKLMPFLHELLEIDPYKVDILDLGAMQIDDQKNSYDVLIKNGMVKLFLIDPLVKKQNINFSSFDKDVEFCFFPFAAGNGGKNNFYECKMLSMSSIFQPNIELCSEFHGYSEYMEVINKKEIKTIRLDDIKEINDVDLYKSDVQGSDLIILEGGGSTIKKATILEIEVEFIEQYKGQPVFSDIDSAIRKHGFCFHTFTGYGTRPLKPLLENHKRYLGKLNQWLWANAVYIRDISSWDYLEVKKIKSMARIMHDVYESIDYSCRALLLIDFLEKSDLCNKYRKKLQSIGYLQ